MSDLNGIGIVERDDPRFTAIADATTFSGFTALAEPDPERPSNRRILALSLIALFLALFLAQATYFISTVLTDEYRSRTEVQYRGSAWTETQDVQVQSRSITGPVAAEFGIPIKDFEEDLDAGLVPGTQVIRIDYVGADSAQAEQIVAAVANGYINTVEEYKLSDITVILDAELAAITAEIAEKEENLAEIGALVDEQRRLEDEAKQAADAEKNGSEVAEPAEPIVIGFDGLPVTEDAELRAEQQLLQQRLNSLRARENDLQYRILDNKIRVLDKTNFKKPEVITEPFTFEDPVFPRPRLFAAIAFLAGLAIGAIIMILNWNHTAWASIDAITRRLPGGDDQSHAADLDHLETEGLDLDGLDLDGLAADAEIDLTDAETDL